MSLPTVHHVFCKADPIGGKEVRSQVICLEANLPEFSLEENPIPFYEMEAEAIARILLDTLPRATIERLSIKLMENWLTMYRGLLK